MLETAEAAEKLDDYIDVPGIDEIHIGLNDLHLSYGKTFMFELLIDGTVDRLSDTLRKHNMRFGFGGIARIGYGLLPAEKILIHLDARPFENLEEKVATENFHGVYYGQSALPLKPEKIVYLTNPELDAMSVLNYETGKTGGIYDFEKLNGKDPYEFYLSGAVPLLEVTNSSAEGERHLIIFRDSFGSSLSPLLMRDYSKITIIDTRYLLPNFIGNYVDFEGADVLMMYSTIILNDSFIIKK